MTSLELKCVICNEHAPVIGQLCYGCYMKASIERQQSETPSRKIITPEDYFIYWREQHPERKPFSVQEFLKYEAQKRIKKNKVTNISTEHNIVTGIINKIEKFRDSGTKYFWMKDKHSRSSIRVLLDNRYRELIDDRLIGESVQVLATYKSESSILNPAVIIFEAEELLRDKPFFTEALKRMAHRDKTAHLNSKVRERDNNTCQMCHMKRGRIDVHHRDYEERTSDEEYMKSMWLLCGKCHDKHTKEQARAGQFENTKIQVDPHNHKLSEY